MKIKEALEIAQDCGLDSVGEAIFNIRLHAGSLFAYKDVTKELQELNMSWLELKDSSGGRITMESRVDVALVDVAILYAFTNT